MQFFCGLRDHASLIARACELVGAGRPAAVAAGDRRGAVRCATGDLVELHLPGKTVIQADHDHAEMNRLVMMENSVVSWPPCWVAVELKAPPTLPCSRPLSQSPPAWSRKFAICEDIRPKRVPVPTMIAS